MRSLSRWCIASCYLLLLLCPAHLRHGACLTRDAVHDHCVATRNKLFTVSCLRLGYDPKRWTVVRKQRIGDLYEAMYQADLKVRQGCVPRAPHSAWRSATRRQLLTSAPPCRR